jgi:MerR family transcriptional regulator, copper efflux regulator
MSQKFHDYLTVKGAAQFLGVSPKTLRNWDRLGKLKPCRHPMNGYRLYRQDELECLLKAIAPSRHAGHLGDNGGADSVPDR